MQLWSLIRCCINQDRVRAISSRPYCGSILLLPVHLSRWSSDSEWWADGFRSNRTRLLFAFDLVRDSLVLLSKILEVQVYTVLI